MVREGKSWENEDRDNGKVGMGAGSASESMIWVTSSGCRNQLLTMAGGVFVISLI